MDSSSTTRRSGSDPLARILFFWLPYRRAIFALGSVFAAVLFGAATYAYVDAGEVYDYQDSVDGAHLPDVDAIVVLAGGRGRIAGASDLWFRYWEHAQAGVGRTPLLYISGMGPHSTFRSLAHQVRRGVMPVLRSEDVILETVSENTVENAQFTLRSIQERGWKSILLITSSYHMKRSRLIFEREFARSGANVRIETLSVIQEPFAPEEWRGSIHGIRVTLTEYLKLIYYRAFWKP